MYIKHYILSHGFVSISSSFVICNTQLLAMCAISLTFFGCKHLVMYATVIFIIQNCDLFLYPMVVATFVLLHIFVF